MKKLYTSFVAFALLSTLIIGCSDDNKESDTGGNSMTLSGQFVVSSDLSPVASRLALGTNQSYDTLINAIAVPIASDRIMMDEAVALEIQSDGYFSAPITPEYAWIVILEELDHSIRFLSLPLSSDLNTTLVTFFPISDLDFGKVTYNRVSDEADSDKNISEMADQFEFSFDQLKSLARTDDIYKSVANSYRNNYERNISQRYVEEIGIVSIAENAVEVGRPVRADAYTGFSINFGYGQDTLMAQKSEAICQNSVSFGLKFPDNNSTLMTSQETYTGFMQSINMVDHNEGGHPSCEMNNSFSMSLFNDGPEVGGKVGFFRGETMNMLAQNRFLEKGLYQLYIAENDLNTTVVEFELDYNLPTSRSGKLLLPIPSIQLHLDNSGVADYLDIVWFLYNESIGDYEEIDFNTFATLCHEISAGTWVGDGIDQENETLFSANYDRIYLESSQIDWNNRIDVRFGIQYKVGSSHIRFSFSKNGYTP